MWWILSIIPLAVIVYQDIRYRAISWWTLPLLFIFMFLDGFKLLGLTSLLDNLLVNFSILIFELLLLTIYFSIKEKKLTNLFKSYLGLGDVLFFLAIIPVFHPFLYVVFQVVGLAIILCVALVYGLIKKDWSFKVPLAGILSIFLLIFLVVNYFSSYELCLKH